MVKIEVDCFKTSSFVIFNRVQTTQFVALLL